MKLFRFIPALALVIGLGVPATLGAQSSAATSELARLAAEADTPAKHTQVAKQLRAKAADLNAKAVKHEAEVRRLERQRFPVEHKMPPALAHRPTMRERELAMEARRGAREALAQADMHTQLAVELLAAR